MAKKPKKPIPKNLFAPDEMNLCQIQPDWTEEDLLKQTGVFFLKDVVKVLNCDSLKVKRRARDMIANGQNVWEIMGARKVWNHWIVRMTVFGPYFLEHLQPKVRSIDPAWDGNHLLQQQGLFLLTEVCQLIPFSTHQLRYQAKRNPNAKQEYGIWKDKELSAFVVDMDVFSVWIYSLWEGKLHRGDEQNK